jgi:mannose-1-phosphate guanylyltransferase
MLRHTIGRVEMLIPPERLLTVISRSHLPFAEPQLADRPGDTIIIEPRNCETGPAILHALLHVRRNDPEAVVGLFPSDHFILPESRFMAYVTEAAETVSMHPECLLLLGVQPSFLANGYGWIEKGERLSMEVMGQGPGGEIYHVQRFIVKPPLRMAHALYLAGSLWNTLVVVGNVQTLMRLFARFTPSLFAEFSKIEDSIGTSREVEVIESMYLRIHSVNFSDEILEKNPEELRVLEIKDVYWSDWGVPERLVSDFRTFFPGTLPPVETSILDEI